ncbi:alcohol dehydrogenase catalytic domain-containing protein [Bacillus cytotoxicus]
MFIKKKGGISHTFPVTLGSQGVGTVEAIGPNVETIQVGDRVVCAGGSGTYASHVLISSQRVIPIPDEISFEHAVRRIDPRVSSLGIYELCLSDQKRRLVLNSCGDRWNRTLFYAKWQKYAVAM